MTKVFAALLIMVIIAIPVLLIILVIRAFLRKSVIPIAISVGVCFASILPLAILGAMTDPATWCKHEREIVSTTDATCTQQGKIIEYCSECDTNVTSYIDKISHNYQFSETVEATCTQPGYTLEKCTMCSATQKTKTKKIDHSWVTETVEATCTEEGYTLEKCGNCSATGKKTRISKLDHDMKEISRTEGKIVIKCERCGQEQIKTIPREESISNNDDFIKGDSGEVDSGKLPSVEFDNLVNELIKIGFTTEEATKYREVFLKCGIHSIAAAESTNPSATIDELVAYRAVLDKDRTLWFTIEKRELFYIALNGVDVYDTSKGGFLITIDDVYIPESEITLATAATLRDKTERVLEPYFINALYYDGWRYGRSDENYMVQCEVYAKNRLGIKDWIFAKVWYKYDGKEFVVTAIVIDGIRYK